MAERKLVILDGAMGTQLAARGGIQGALSNVRFPDVVKAVHAEYKAAGVDAVLTNTLTANRIYLEHAGMADEFEALNTLGVELCREAVGDECWVLGDMTSTGAFLEPLGDYTEDQFHDAFSEQASLLARCGVDGIIIETMTDVREASIAVRAAAEASGLPVLVSIAFDPVADGFRTMMGDTIEKAAAELTAAGANAIGANCGTLDPVEVSEVIARMRALTDAALLAEPNAGKPQMQGAEVRFNLGPEEFADGAAKCIEAGATLVGGCCGTSPAHIEALARRVR